MSERVEKLIAEENAEIIRMLTEDEAIYVEAHYFLDKSGKRVYNWAVMQEEFKENMENLIALNKQKGLSYGEIVHD
jgi:hypothetical protein